MFKVGINSVQSLKFLKKTLSSGFLNEGEQVAEFKDAVANYLKVKNIVLTNSCNDLILDSIKYDKKSELSSYNFTLLKNIGQSVVNCSVDDSEILRSLDFYKKLCQL